MLNQVKIDVNAKFEERIPQAIRALKQVSNILLETQQSEPPQLPDFYMELSWSFGSWVPLVSKFCPYDNYKIWKKGSCVRVDTTLIGFENLKWVRGNISFIFSETLRHPLGSDDSISSHVVIINHEKKKVEFALDSFKRYSLGNSEKHDLRHMIQNPMVRMQLMYDNITFDRCKNWFGYNKTESVGWYIIYGRFLRCIYCAKVNGVMLVYMTLAELSEKLPNVPHQEDHQHSLQQKKKKI